MSTRHEPVAHMGSMISQSGLKIIATVALFHLSGYLILMGISMMFAVHIVLNLSPDPLSFLLVALLIYAVYGTNRLIEAKKDAIDNPQRARFFLEHQRALKASFWLTALLALLLAALRSPLLFAIAAVPLFLVIFYTSPQLPRRLKDVPVVKNLTPATGWAVVSVLVPILFSPAQIEANVVAFLFLFVLLSIFIASVVYDAKDIQSDLIHGVRTLWTMFGVSKAKCFLMGLTALILCCFVALGTQLLRGYNYLSFVGLACMHCSYVLTYLYFFERFKDPEFLSQVVAITPFVLWGPVAHLIVSIS